LKKSHHLNLNVTAVLCLLALSLVMTLVAGCSSNAVAPNTNNSNITTGQTDPDPRLDPDKTVSGLIGPRGGLLQVMLDGSTPTIFRFPKGALKVETLITIRAYRVQMRFGTMDAFDCGPDGTVFDVPIEVTYTTPPGKTTANLLYYNEDSAQWELQELSLVSRGCVQFHIYHFSKYGIEASQVPIDLTVDDGTTSQ
jgi:hypothetical protein